MLAGKLPLDASISDFEAYSESYGEQLEDRKALLEGDVSIYSKYDVRYVVGEDCNFRKIHENPDICVIE